MCKQKFTTATWNVRTLFQTGKIQELSYEMGRYSWNVLGIAETRWTQKGEFITDDGHKIWYSGETNKHEKGVAFMVHKNTRKSVIQCTPINSRIITLGLGAKPYNVTIIQIYAPTSKYEDEEIEEFYQNLGDVISQQNRKDMLIIQGDWNAKIGADAYDTWKGTTGKYGLGKTNSRGLRLLEFAKENNLIVANTIHRHKASRTITWHSPGGLNHNQIDFILISKRYQSSINGAKTRVFPGADIGSDHELLMMTLKVKLKIRNRKPNTKIKYDIEKLRDPNVAAEFQSQIGGRFAPLLLLQEKNNNIQEITKSFEEVLTTTAETVLGRKIKSKHPWINDEILISCDERRKLKRIRHKDDNTKYEYKLANKKVRKEISFAKESWINEQCSEIETNHGKNKTKEAYQIVKTLTTEWKPRCQTIEDKNGKLLTKPDEVTERWREYCEQLYNHKAETNDNSINYMENEISPEEYQEPNITLDEVRNAVKKLKCNKSPGIDNINAELLKYGGESVIKMLHKICNNVIHTGEWPNKWTESIIIPLPKKGNMNKCENNRTISLISHPSKVLLHILLTRMKPTIKELLSETQAGFQEGRSTIEQICNVRILSEKYIEHQKELYHNFIDFKKAFDRVWHKALWTIMKKYNLSRTIINAVKSLYEHAKSLVLIGDIPSNWFKTTVGVRQGCVLSPSLFNVFLEYIMTEALETFEGGAVIGGKRITNLRFADDIDLIGESEEELRELTTRLEHTTKTYGMEISVEKSKIMITGKDSDGKNLSNPININGQSLQQVKSFKYLGSTISHNLKSNNEVKCRFAIASASLAKLDPILKNKNIRIKTKIRFIRAIVIATALYGCETWTLNAEIEKKINAFEMKCYRKTLRVSYLEHRTNASVKDEIVDRTGSNYETLLSIVKRRKMRWFGHVTRHNDTLPLANIIMHGRTPGNRGRGRPRKNWLENIREWTRKKGSLLTHLAYDRSIWRNEVAMTEVHLRPP